MRIPSFLLCLFLSATLWSQSQPVTDYWITQVKVVDIPNGQLLDGLMDIHIKENRITAIEKSNKKRRKNTTTYDAKGQYLIPGLWDMHTHPDDPEVWWMTPVPEDRDQMMPLFVLNGVTGTRDMAGDLELVKDWRKRIKKGELLGPEIIAAGPLLDGANASWDGSVSIADKTKVRHIVDSLKTAGIDFLKVYSGLPRDVFFALAEYARDIDFPLVGHIPWDVTTVEGAKAGMNCQEHLLSIILECSTAEEDIRNEKIDYGDAENGLDRYYIRNKLMMDHYSEEKAATLFKAYAKYKTWHTPTLSMWYKNAYYETEKSRDEDLFKYLPKYLRKYWQPDTNVHLKYRQQKIVGTKQRQFDFYLKIVKGMHQAGVPLLAGTDVGANPLCWPGIGVHNELEMFVRAGLSPSEALKTATINPVTFLRMEQDFGSIETGKVADLVLLKENPLKNIQAVRNIQAVIKSGVLYNRAAIDEQLQQIETFLGG